MSETMSKNEFEIDPNAQCEPDPEYLEHRRKEQQAYRSISTKLGFFRACSQKPCSRAKACVGDGKPCFNRWWPHVHPEVRALMRGIANAYHHGAPIEEARRKGLAESDEWNRRFMAGEFSEEARTFLEGPLAKLPLVG